MFSLPEIQDLLDEWIVTGWQNRPHGGLRDPFTPSRVLTPNDKYAALLAVSGYVPVPFGAEDYLELMPAETRVINSYGVKIRHRIYDTAELNPFRGQKSGMKALNGLWEVRYDPYDAGRIWVRNHHDGGWITAYWRTDFGPLPSTSCGPAVTFLHAALAYDFFLFLKRPLVRRDFRPRRPEAAARHRPACRAPSPRTLTATAAH